MPGNAPPSAMVGLDIGADSIKVAEARYGKDGISVTALGIARTPEGVIENEVIVDPKALANALKGKRAPLKAALLDQRVVAGLGNIYVCEALHRSGLSPLREAGSLVLKSGKPAKALADLTKAIKTVLQEAIAAGGSTISDHRQADGALGYFQHSFRVYDREGAACPTPGCHGTVARIAQAGRSSFCCTCCQK